MNELEELYNNASSYAEDFGPNTSYEWVELKKEIEKLHTDLSTDFSDKQREKLKQLKDLYTRQVCLETDRMFYYAFRSGARLIIDIQNE